MALSLPPSISGRDAVTVSMISGTCPPMISVIAVARALCTERRTAAPCCAPSGTRTRCAPSCWAARCRPTFGSAFAAAITSAIELTGDVGLAEITIGNVPVRMIGSKSFSGSNADVGVEELVDAVRGIGAHRQRVAVGGARAAASFRCCRPRRAVLDEEVLAQALRELLGDVARRDIGALPGLIGDDDAHGLVRIALRGDVVADASAISAAAMVFSNFICCLPCVSGFSN